MLAVIMKNKNLIKINETRTISRFQHIFDKIADSDDQSRKWTENSNQQSDCEGEHSSDAGPKDIFHMNIVINNNVKDQNSNF